MNLTEMRDSLREKVGNPTIGDVTDTKLSEHLNTAYRDIAVKYRFHGVRRRCSFPTVIDIQKYVLPTDVGALFKVWDVTNKRPLVKIGHEQLPDNLSDTSGQPLQYLRSVDWIELYPIPDAVYTIEMWYKTQVADLASPADEPAIPLPWHVGIVNLGRWYYWDEKGDIPKARWAMDNFKVWVSDMPVEVDEETVGIDSGVRIPTLLNNFDKGLEWDKSL